MIIGINKNAAKFEKLQYQILQNVESIFVDVKTKNLILSIRSGVENVPLLSLKLTSWIVYTRLKYWIWVSAQENVQRFGKIFEFFDTTIPSAIKLLGIGLDNSFFENWRWIFRNFLLPMDELTVIWEQVTPFPDFVSMSYNRFDYVWSNSVFPNRIALKEVLERKNIKRINLKIEEEFVKINRELSLDALGFEILLRLTQLCFSILFLEYNYEILISLKGELPRFNIQKKEIICHLFPQMVVYKDPLFDFKKILMLFKDLKTHFGIYIGSVLTSQFAGLFHAFKQNEHQPMLKLLQQLLFYYAFIDPLFWYRAKSFESTSFQTDVKKLYDPARKKIKNFDNFDKLMEQWAGSRKMLNFLRRVYKTFKQYNQEITFNESLMDEAILKYLPMRNFINKVLEHEIHLINTEEVIGDMIQKAYEKQGDNGYLNEIRNYFEKNITKKFEKQNITRIYYLFCEQFWEDIRGSNLKHTLQSFFNMYPNVLDATKLTYFFDQVLKEQGKVQDVVIEILNNTTFYNYFKDLINKHPSEYDHIWTILDEDDPMEHNVQEEKRQILEFLLANSQINITSTLKKLTEHINGIDFVKIKDEKSKKKYKDKLHDLIVKLLNPYGFPKANLKDFKDYDPLKAKNFQESGSLNTFDVFTLTQRIVDVTLLRTLNKYRIKDDDYRFQYLNLNETLNKNFSIPLKEEIDPKSKLASWLSMNVQSEILEISLILAKIFIYDKFLSWEDRLTEQQWFWDTKIFIDNLTETQSAIVYERILPNIPVIDRGPKAVEEYCLNFVKTTIQQANALRPEKTFRQKITYREFTLKRYILNWILIICYRNYYLIGNKLGKRNRNIIIGLRYPKSQYDVTRVTKEEEVDDLDSLLYLPINKVHKLETLDTSISKIKMSYIKVLLVTQQAAIIYRHFASKGLDYIFWKLKPSILTLEPVNLLTSKSLTLVTDKSPLFTIGFIKNMGVLLIQLSYQLTILQKFFKTRLVKESNEISASYQKAASFLKSWLHKSFSRSGFLGLIVREMVDNAVNSGNQYQTYLFKNGTEEMLIGKIEEIHSQLYPIFLNLLSLIWELFGKLNNVNLIEFAKLLRLIMGKGEKSLFEKLTPEIVLQIYLIKKKVYRSIPQDLNVPKYERMIQLSLSKSNFSKQHRGLKGPINFISAISFFLAGPRHLISQEAYKIFYGLMYDLFRGYFINPKIPRGSGRFSIHYRVVGGINTGNKEKFKKEGKKRNKNMRLFKRMCRLFFKKGGKNDYIYLVATSFNYI